jgi:hypothetical protein
MKNLLKVFFAISFLLALAFTNNTYAQDWSKDQKEVWTVVADSWKKWADDDIEGTLAYFHEKYQGWSEDRPLPVGKAKLASLWESRAEIMKISHYDIEPARITIVGNSAVVDYYFEFGITYKLGEEKATKEMYGKNAEFYVKEGGKWLLLGDMTLHEEDD